MLYHKILYHVVQDFYPNFYYLSPKRCFDLEEVTCCYLWLFQVCSMYSSRAPLWTSTTHNVTIWKVSSVSNQPIRAKENIIRSQWELVNNCVWQKRGKTCVTNMRLAPVYLWLVAKVARVFETNHSAKKRKASIIPDYFKYIENIH